MTTQRDQPGDPGFRGDLGPRRPSEQTTGGGGGGESPAQALQRLAQQLIDDPSAFISIRKEWMEITGLSARQAESELDQAERALRGETPVVDPVINEEGGVGTAEEFGPNLPTTERADFSPGSLGEFAINLGIDIEDPANSAILPNLREAFASSTGAGRRGLFGDAVNDVLPIGGPDILRNAFSGLGDRASTNFLFANALGQAPTLGAGGGDFPTDINLGGSFSSFLRQPGALGNFGGEGNLQDFLQLAQDPNALAFRQGEEGFRPEAFNLRQQLVNSPGSAFDFIGSQFQGPAFSPFAGAASRARDRIFGQFQRDNPNLTGLDFLDQFGQGNFSGLF